MLAGGTEEVLKVAFSSQAAENNCNAAKNRLIAETSSLLTHARGQAHPAVVQLFIWCILSKTSQRKQT